MFFPGAQHRNMQPFSDEDASIETMSHCSGFSDPASLAEDGMLIFLSCAETHCVLYKVQASPGINGGYVPAPRYKKLWVRRNPISAD